MDIVFKVASKPSTADMPHYVARYGAVCPYKWSLWRCSAFHDDVTHVTDLGRFTVTSLISNQRKSARIGRCTPSGYICLQSVLCNFVYDISNIDDTPTTKKGITPHKKIKERKTHNNCLRKASNNKRRKTKSSTVHSSITTILMD
jgi:hypothetical protein